MDQHDDGHPAAEDEPTRLSRRTTPTWEIEMLLSGATVFALMQLAGALPAWGVYLLPRLADPWLELGRLMLLYGHSAVVLLCLAFLLHLLMRGYWVALVGMHSVFPGGLKLEKLRAGPIAKSLLARNWQDMDAAIERADNRATVVFGLGIGLTLVLLLVTVSALLLFLVSLGVAMALGNATLASPILMALLAIWLGPQLLAGYLDRRFGHRLSPTGWPYRILHRTLHLYSRTGTSRESSPLVTIYSSNVGEKRSNWVVLAVMLLATVLSLASAAFVREDLGPGNYAGFPEGSGALPRAVHHAHYATRHEAGETPDLPFVPDLVARGRYLPLVVPYVPTLHQHLLAGCPGAGPGRDAAARTARHQAALDCLAAGLVVRLDGEPLALPPEAYSDADRDLRGLLYMIPIDALPVGRHELHVTLRPDEPPEDGEPQAWRIPFWR
ncbi:hypothetical protein [Arenimonas sp.]|uniref:hypothetical protein n=1 Tax=Arenimonas sp. TaxID=1872635 RepID=UPI0025C249FE|nr:hypothetical protein [Arenimonas sp.]